MAINIFRPRIENHRRIIVVSDVFGNYDTLRRLLDKVGYSREDYLFVLGNITERGPQGLATLRFLMETGKNRRVFALAGDYDMVSKEVFRADRNAELLQYVLRNHSVIRDMCAEIGIPLTPQSNMHQIKLVLREAFSEELGYLSELPHVIEIPGFVFAHAQILPGDPEEMTPGDVIKAEGFLNKGFSFDRYVVVGHYPNQRYPEAKRCANPIINRARHIICIDGGMTKLRDGQLNALVIPSLDSDQFTYAFVDDFPKKIAQNSQDAGMERHLIQYPDNRVKVLNTTGDMCYCRQEKTERNFWIPKVFIRQTENGTVTEDYTDYQLKVTFEDELSVILETSRGALVKRDGVTGWYYGLLQ
ncbi:MAG: metallophosphoesterase [Lachnospiraceae bacterium]|nr:metallophosphoesterase [Lachnospiraceae bacterium]